MENRNELISYSMDFASYLISKINGINKIILHGSIPRGDFNQESDIDIFVDINEPGLKARITKALENYYKTARFREWKLKGIENPISIIVGDIEKEEWKDIKRAIINTGIILYGKYKAEAEKIFQYVLVSFENIKPDKKRIAIYRKLFGFNAGKIKYPGMIEKINGAKVGKGTFIIPATKINELNEYIEKKKISIKVYDIWSDYKLV